VGSVTQSRRTTAAPRSHPLPSASAAFTLIELLVVLVILGVTAGLIAVNLSDDGEHRAEREARRLAGALEHAAALAQWRGETLGVSADGGAYRFWRRGADDRWSALGDDDVLAAHAMPVGITVVAASFAGAPVAADAILPFRATGRNEPYALSLSSPAWSFYLSSDPLNRVQIGAAVASR
jgi:general secretion pathway protein H